MMAGRTITITLAVTEQDGDDADEKAVWKNTIQLHEHEGVDWGAQQHLNIGLLRDTAKNIVRLSAANARLQRAVLKAQSGNGEKPRPQTMREVREIHPDALFLPRLDCYDCRGHGVRARKSGPHEKGSPCPCILLWRCHSPLPIGREGHERRKKIVDGMLKGE